MAQHKILLFIPGYNCAKQLPRVLRQLDAEALSFIDEVIFVNNRSTDETEGVALQFIAEHPALPLRVLRNDENYGLGGSHKVAFAYALAAHFEYVIVLHGDDQGDIHDLLPLLQAGRHLQVDCLLGARFQPGAKLAGYSRFRTFGNRVYNLLFSLVAGLKIYDLGSGLNLYRTAIFADGFYRRFPDNLTFNYCMILAASYYQQHIAFFPISWKEDDQVSNVKLFSQAMNVLKMLWQFLLHRKAFITSELRMTPREEYTAQIINQQESKRA